MAKPGELAWGFMSIAVSGVAAFACSLISVMCFVAIERRSWKAAADRFHQHYQGRTYDNLIPGIECLLVVSISWVCFFAIILWWRWMRASKTIQESGLSNIGRENV
jgi:uncharacterized membrane protein required for colicin V production